MKRKPQIELIPDLTHCVETKARQKYQKLVRSYLLKSKRCAEPDEKIELLRTFLETADFRKLRKESEAYLLKGQKVKFIVRREDGETKYKLVFMQ